MVVKIYGASGENETRYSPAKCLGGIPTPIVGDPDPKHISTSYVERQNLTMRMSMRRFTRRTNAFSKKLENHAATVALYFMSYYFARVHQTLHGPATCGVDAHACEPREATRHTRDVSARCLGLPRFFRSAIDCPRDGAEPDRPVSCWDCGRFLGHQMAR